jgi:hypothetical protein
VPNLDRRVARNRRALPLPSGPDRQLLAGATVGGRTTVSGMSESLAVGSTLPDGFHARTYAASSGEKSQRGGTIITGPDGTRVTFYDGGGLRVFRPDHELQTRGHTNRDPRRAGEGASVYIDFTPRRSVEEG